MLITIITQCVLIEETCAETIIVHVSKYNIHSVLSHQSNAPQIIYDFGKHSHWDFDSIYRHQCNINLDCLHLHRIFLHPLTQLQEITSIHSCGIGKFVMSTGASVPSLWFHPNCVMAKQAVIGVLDSTQDFEKMLSKYETLEHCWLVVEYQVYVPLKTWQILPRQQTQCCLTLYKVWKQMSRLLLSSFLLVCHNRNHLAVHNVPWIF